MRHAMVDKRPCSLRTILSPTFISIKQPVPYVFLTMPFSRHACPNKEACWSPAMAATGIGRPRIAGSSMPITSLESTTLGRHARGTSSIFSSSSSQSWVSKLNIMVRPALVASVTCGLPVTKCHARKLSTVPKHNSPRSAFSCKSR